MDQERKSLQLTKQVKSDLEPEENRDFYPDIETVNTHDLCAKIVLFNIKRKVFSDLTGDFSHKSSKVHLYAIVMYDYGSNEILSKPIKIRRQKPFAMLSSISTTY